MAKFTPGGFAPIKSKVENDSNTVRVYWCSCGTCIRRVTAIEYLTPKIKREYTEAKKWGLKVEDMTYAEFKSKPFMTCNCFNSNDI